MNYDAIEQWILAQEDCWNSNKRCYNIQALRAKNKLREKPFGDVEIAMVSNVAKHVRMMR